MGMWMGRASGRIMRRIFPYYYHRPAVDDMHGYGPVILCGSEIIKLVKNDKLRITVGPNAPVVVTERK